MNNNNSQYYDSLKIAYEYQNKKTHDMVFLVKELRKTKKELVEIKKSIMFRNMKKVAMFLDRFHS